MQYGLVHPRGDAPERDPRVHADLDALMRLQFQASGFSYLPRQPVHSVLYGRHASRLRGRGLNFEELRAYRPGDDIRTLDWKASTRARHPQVRVYTEERDRPVWLVVDQRVSMFFGSVERTKSVTAAEAAAVSAWRVQGLGDRVGALVFDDHQQVLLRPQGSRNHVMRILSAIVERNQALDASLASDCAALNRALTRLNGVLTHDALVVLITDAYGADDQSVELVTRMGQHNDLILAFVFDPLERELPNAGRLGISDGQARLDVDMGSKRLRGRFADDFERRLDEMQRLSRRRRIPLLRLNTAEPVLDQVRAQLGVRPAGRN